MLGLMQLYSLPPSYCTYHVQLEHQLTSTILSQIEFSKMFLCLAQCRRQYKLVDRLSDGPVGRGEHLDVDLSYAAL